MASIVLSSLILALLFGAIALLLALAERRLLRYGPCRLRINGGARAAEVAGGQTVLSALAACGIYPPAACGGKGTCGFCKVRFVTDAPAVLATERPFLSRQEIRSGVRLACQVKLRGDAELELSPEVLDVRMFTAHLAAVRDLSDHVRELTLALDDPTRIDQQPGQYVQVCAPSSDGDVVRAYSIASPGSHGDRVTLVVRRVPGGMMSNYLHDLPVGETVRFTGPFGQWRPDPRDACELICIAGGVGVAPLRNVVHSILADHPSKRCRLFVGCRSASEALYRDEFGALARQHEGLRVVYSLSTDEPGYADWTGERGMIHEAVERHLDASQGPRQAYLAGPAAMVEAVHQVLERKGLRAHDIFWDDFLVQQGNQ